MNDFLLFLVKTDSLFYRKGLFIMKNVSFKGGSQLFKQRITFKQFWELSEIYTAPLNLFIILLGVSLAHFWSVVSLSLPLFLFIGVLLSFHLAVNIFNHWMDFENASDENYKKYTNIIGRDGLSLPIVKKLFWFWFAFSLFLGSLLVFQTNLWIGILGLIGFYVGLFYSYGRRPLNSLPIAETLTSLASGFFISLLAYYLVTF